MPEMSDYGDMVTLRYDVCTANDDSVSFQ
jgi:hypothetical protein